MPQISNIRIDYRHGIRQAVQHLAALRHIRIAFITGPLHLKTALARRIAFEQSMKEIGLEVPSELIIEGDHTNEGGIRAFKELTKLRDRPSAIICSNDMTAIGVIREAYDFGLKVPQDLSVVGFDDIHLAQFMIPPLTTVQMSQSELAKLAFRALMSEVGRENSTPHGTEFVLTTNLVLRKSTGLCLNT